MIISEVIKMLNDAKSKHGDIAVYVDLDYAQREVKEDEDPLCKCPEFQRATNLMPDRIVI